MSLPYRRLILMRHAKSDWSSGATNDHARPLNERGREDAPRMGGWLASRDLTPDAVVCSDATRTWETWERMSGAWSRPPLLRVSRDLYHAGLPQLIQNARTWESGWTTVLALGHNPGWEEAVHLLSGHAEPMKTGACAVLEGEGETWTDALLGSWRLVETMRPRALTGT